jgi:sugar lactone lactonase YvrE
MSELRQSLERGLPPVSGDSSDALSSVLGRAARRRRRQRVIKLSAAVIAAAIVVVGAVQLPATSNQSVAAEVDTALEGRPLQASSGLGSIWVLTCQRRCQLPQSSGQLVEVDSGTGRVVRRIAVANPSAFAIADRSLWVADFWTGRVKRIDPHTGRSIQTIALTLPRPIAASDRRFLPSSMTAGAGTVWVATARGWLAKIDARSGRLASMIRAPFDATGRSVVGPHGLWVAESVLGVGHVPDAAARLRVTAIRAGRHNRIAVDELAVGHGRVWLYGLVSRPANPAAGGYVLTERAELVALDEATARIAHELQFPAGPYQIAYGSGNLFAADFATGQLYRVDSRYELHRMRPVHGPGTLIAITPGAIWATTTTGTLRRITVPRAH